MVNPKPGLSQQTYTVISHHISKSEEPVKHPYLDIKGHITIGTGFKVNSEDDFARLDLGFKRDGQFVPATDQEKRTAYQTMMAIRKDRNGDFDKKANSYRNFTTIRMPNSAIDAKLQEEIMTRVDGIRTRVGDAAWDKLNDQQKAAVVDVVYANGSLDKFPRLKDAIVADDPKAMADQSPFYTDKENGKRDMERLKRNYAALSGLNQAQSNAALETVLNKSPDTNDTIPTPTEDARNEQDTGLDSTPTTTPVDDDAIKQLGASLTAPGDAVDEALLKPDLTEGELSGLMRSKPYLSVSDPRYSMVQRKVRTWHEDRWGNEAAKTDATGRMVADDAPRLPAPVISMTPVESPTGRPLDDAVGKIAKTIMGRATKTTVPDAVRTLQNTLNNEDDPAIRPVPPLKTDGIAGPVTRRVLRFATAHTGADNLLKRFGRRM